MESNWRLNVAKMGIGLLPVGDGVNAYPCSFCAKLNPPLPVGVGVWTWLVTWERPEGRTWLLCTEPVLGYVEPSVIVPITAGVHFPGPFSVDPD